MHTKHFDLGRFSDPSLLILASLANGPKHGYAMMEDIAEFCGTRLEPGTLDAAHIASREQESVHCANNSRRCTGWFPLGSSDFLPPESNRSLICSSNNT